jgi:hypothetical protein
LFDDLVLNFAALLRPWREAEADLPASSTHRGFRHPGRSFGRTPHLL